MPVKDSSLAGIIYRKRAAKQPPSTNTKTKLDLTRQCGTFSSSILSMQIYIILINYVKKRWLINIYCVKNVVFSLCNKRILSKITIAAIDSTIATARGNTQGSCLPCERKVMGVPSRSTEDWSFISVATGLNATLKYMSSPLLIPPCMPPL